MPKPFHDPCNEMKFGAGQCQFPTGPETLCGATIPARSGPGRPRSYCADAQHNAVRAHRAARRYADERAAGQASAVDLAAELERARQLVADAERARHSAEVNAHAARRERDAALGLRDLAVEDAAHARTEAAEAVSRMRQDFDRSVAQVAAVADAEISRAVTAHTLGDRGVRRIA